MKARVEQMLDSIEKDSLPEIRTYLEEHFSQTFLPSHDHSHHLRTWKIARDILMEMGTIDDHIAHEFIEAVMYSVLFHDTGMTITKGERHGHESAKIYRNYVHTVMTAPPAMHEEIVQTILEHDQKNHRYYLPPGSSGQSALLAVTGAADDLDALGTIGIYRYAEIYLHRGIPLRSLGNRIMENAATRFNTFVKAFALLPGFIGKHTRRYQELIDFFDRYNQQLLTESNPDNTLGGHIGVVNFIYHFSVKGTLHPAEIPEKLGASAGKLVVDFFDALGREFSGSS
jgi:HD superfamily phosphodiesterase